MPESENKPTDQRQYNLPRSSSSMDILFESLLCWVGHFFFILMLPLLICASVKVVLDYERCIIFRLGRMRGGPRGPGPIFLNPLLDDDRTIDMRTVTFDVPQQEILTQDSVTVAVDAVVYFRVFEPVFSVLNVVDAGLATKLLAASTLRTMLGTMSLAEILGNRESISTHMQSQLDEATDFWGIKVERVEIKDVVLPKQLQRAMAAEAEASREAKAKVIAAEGEYRASQSLQAAAEVISKAPAALHLRYLQTLNTISAENSSTVVFPFPIEMLKK